MSQPVLYGFELLLVGTDGISPFKYLVIFLFIYIATATLNQVRLASAMTDNPTTFTIKLVIKTY